MDECYKALQYMQVAVAQEKVELDLEFTGQIGGNNPKNYQIWYHRRNLLEYVFSTIVEDDIDLVKRELDYIASVFEIDGKNYHVRMFVSWYN